MGGMETISMDVRRGWDSLWSTPWDTSPMLTLVVAAIVGLTLLWAIVCYRRMVP